MVKWSSSDLAKIGIDRAFKKKSPQKRQNRSRAKGNIELILKHSGCDYVREHKFLEDRRFRFDWAIPDLKVGIEYEGLFAANYSGKSRHTTPTGYINDCRKYNLAVLNGWRVLRYTTRNYRELIDDLKVLVQK